MSTRLCSVGLVVCSRCLALCLALGLAAAIPPASAETQPPVMPLTYSPVKLLVNTSENSQTTTDSFGWFTLPYQGLPAPSSGVTVVHGPISNLLMVSGKSYTYGGNLIELGGPNGPVPRGGVTVKLFNGSTEVASTTTHATSSEYLLGPYPYTPNQLRIILEPNGFLDTSSGPVHAFRGDVYAQP